MRATTLLLHSIQFIMHLVKQCIIYLVNYTHSKRNIMQLNSQAYTVWHITQHTHTKLSEWFAHSCCSVFKRKFDCCRALLAATSAVCILLEIYQLIFNHSLIIAFFLFLSVFVLCIDSFVILISFKSSSDAAQKAHSLPIFLTFFNSKPI